jgi:hypothetical protein
MAGMGMGMGMGISPATIGPMSARLSNRKDEKYARHPKLQAGPGRGVRPETWAKEQYNALHTALSAEK